MIFVVFVLLIVFVCCSSNENRNLDCIEFKKIFDGVNPNKNIILESLSINPFWFNQKVARRFFELYKKDLKTEIMKHFHDFTKDILITCLNTKRKL